MKNEACQTCDLYVNEHCTKYRKNGKCEPSTKDWLIPNPYYDPRNFISIDRMCRKSSIFGNEYIGLTQSDIDRLTNGEILAISVEEYEVFIGFIDQKEKENVNN